MARKSQKRTWSRVNRRRWSKYGRDIQPSTSARLRVWNGLGEVGLTARVTGDIMPGTVLAPGIWWNKHSADGRNVNQLTPQDETDMGASGSFYDVRVQVESI